MNRVRLVAVVVSAAAASAACATSSHGGSTSAAGVRTTLQAFADAKTAAQMCSLYSSGFRFFIGNGSPTHTACVQRYGTVVGEPIAPGKLVVDSVQSDHGQQIAKIKVGAQPWTLYLVAQYGTYKINSIGIREGTGPTPPSKAVYDS